MRGILFTCALLLSTSVTAETLHVGNGYPYSGLGPAISVVMPGDTILIHEGSYSGGLFFANVQGMANAWIFISAAQGETVIFDGGNNAWQFTDAAYLHVSGIIFEHQVGNGVNFDDGGSYDTPAHHVIFENCTFRDMNANGNNDLLKLSGLDDFEIRNCLFFNGASGGSGIDMVGCHDGLITGCRFENMGSNAIQAKGGTRNIRIEGNFFKNCGQRTLNLGGSTGLQFFRPFDAPYEAADLKVYSNIFIGSVAPVAFVGCINTEVVNNTLYLPENWVLRILQETVDTSRFFPCGNNTFRNNLIVLDNRVNIVCNIGPNTAAETFTLSNNLWFHTQQPAWPGPVLPVSDQNNLVNQDPLLTDADQEDFTLSSASPAIGNGFTVTQPALDYTGALFDDPRSIGALEGMTTSGAEDRTGSDPNIYVFPNPVHDHLTIQMRSHSSERYAVIYSLTDEIALPRISVPPGTSVLDFDTSGFSPGVYVLRVGGPGDTMIRFIKH
jgi:hypothetical protein